MQGHTKRTRDMPRTCSDIVSVVITSTAEHRFVSLSLRRLVAVQLQYDSILDPWTTNPNAIVRCQSLWILLLSLHTGSES